MKNAIVLKLNCTVMPGALHCPELRPFRSSSSQQTLQGRFSTILKFCLNELVTKSCVKFQCQFVHGGFEVNGIRGLKASLHWKSILLWGILQFFVIAGQIALRPKRCICLSTLKMASKETQQTTDPLFYPLQWSPWDAVTSTVFKCLLWRRTWTFEPELRSAIPSGATGLFEGFVQYKSSLGA